MALVAAMATAFLTGLAYNGFLQPGDAGRAALIAVGGGAITVLHVHVAVGLVRGWAASRWLAVPVLAAWVAGGLLAFASFGKSSARLVGLFAAVVCALGAVDVAVALRRTRAR